MPAWLLAVFAGVVCYSYSVQDNSFDLGLSIGGPASMRVIIGYSVRLGVWIIGTFLLVSPLMVIGGIFLTNIYSILLGIVFIYVVLAAVPALFGVLLGWAFRIVLQKTNWRKRRFLPLVAFLLVPIYMNLNGLVVRVEPESAVVVDSRVPSPCWCPANSMQRCFERQREILLSPQRAI